MPLISIFNLLQVNHYDGVTVYLNAKNISFYRYSLLVIYK